MSIIKSKEFQTNKRKGKRMSGQTTNVGYNRIICPICHEVLFIFTHVHLEKHGMTKKEFLERYPEYSSTAFWGTLKQHK